MNKKVENAIKATIVLAALSSSACGVRTRGGLVLGTPGFLAESKKVTEIEVKRVEQWRK